MNSPLDSFSLSDLEMLEEYVYYNQPILFSCRDSSGQIYLGFWLEETAAGESWLYLPMSSQRLQEVRTGTIELRDAFLKSEAGWVLKVTTFSDNSADVVEPIDCKKLDECWLPASGEVLKYDPQTLAVAAQ